MTKEIYDRYELEDCDGYKFLLREVAYENRDVNLFIDCINIDDSLQKSNKSLKIVFVFPYFYKFCSDEFDLKLLSDLDLKKYKNKSKPLIYLVENSKLMAWFRHINCNFLDFDKIRHYLIVAEDGYVDVLDIRHPKIELIES